MVCKLTQQQAVSWKEQKSIQGKRVTRLGDFLMIRFCSLHGHAYWSQETLYLPTNDKQLFDLISKPWVTFLFQSDWHCNWRENLLQLGDVLNSSFSWFLICQLTVVSVGISRCLIFSGFSQEQTFLAAQHVRNVSLPHLLLLSHLQWRQRWC